MANTGNGVTTEVVMQWVAPETIDLPSTFQFFYSAFFLHGEDDSRNVLYKTFIAFAYWEGEHILMTKDMHPDEADINDIIFVKEMTVANQKHSAQLPKMRYKLTFQSSTFSNLV